MELEELKTKSLIVWREYGKAIIKAFDFPAGSFIEEDTIERLFKTATEESLTNFISDVETKTKEIRMLK
jgi:hypothetical protein